MHENEISGLVLDACFKVHSHFGPGLFESVYKESLCVELNKSGLNFMKEVGIPVTYDNINLELGFRADLIVENKILIELKSIECIAPVHKKQLLTYLRLTNLKLGLLINFNEAHLKDGITRVVNNL
jgi:GxxExxY protein